MSRTYGRRMRTELPAERLHRRLGAQPQKSTDSDGDVAEDADAGDTDVSLTRWLPDGNTGTATGWLATIRADPGRAGAVALAGVGVLAVLVTVFTVMRDKTPPVVSAKLPPVQMVSSTSPSAGPSAIPPPDQPMVISVVGLVHKPGLVNLNPGARIADALTAAGGALNGADVIGLNMARRVADGEQIVVGIAPLPGEPTTLGSSISSGSEAAGTPSASSGGANAPGKPAQVDLNTATVEQLDTLPGVGPVTAAAIVAWRDTNGRFSSVDQLSDVDGIGPARLDKLRDLVHV